MLLAADESEVAPLVADLAVFREGLFGVGRAMGPRAELQEGLDLAYQHAYHRWEQDGASGLGSSGDGALLEAMIQNQKDARWEPIWFRYLSGGVHPGDYSRGGHEFLPGKCVTGIRGLLELRDDDSKYWIRLAAGVRDIERRFQLTGQARIESDLNVIEELARAVGVVFDYWAEPSAALRLMDGSIELMWAGNGTWAMYAQAAWAYELCTREWHGALRLDDVVSRKTFHDTFASGLRLYADWQWARYRSKFPEESLPPREKQRLQVLQRCSEDASRAVIELQAAA